MAGSGKLLRMWPFKAVDKESRVTALGNHNLKNRDMIPKHHKTWTNLRIGKNIFKALLGEFQSDKIIIDEGTGIALP